MWRLLIDSLKLYWGLPALALLITSWLGFRLGCGADADYARVVWIGFSTLCIPAASGSLAGWVRAVRTMPVSSAALVRLIWIKRCLLPPALFTTGLLLAILLFPRPATLSIPVDATFAGSSAHGPGIIDVPLLACLSLVLAACTGVILGELRRRQPNLPAHWRLPNHERNRTETVASIAVLTALVLKPPTGWQQVDPIRAVAILLGLWLVWRSYAQKEAILYPRAEPRRLPDGGREVTRPFPVRSGFIPTLGPTYFVRAMVVSSSVAVVCAVLIAVPDIVSPGHLANFWRPFLPFPLLFIPRYSEQSCSIRAYRTFPLSSIRLTLGYMIGCAIPIVACALTFCLCFLIHPYAHVGRCLNALMIVFGAWLLMTAIILFSDLVRGIVLSAAFMLGAGVFVVPFFVVGHPERILDLPEASFIGGTLAVWGTVAIHLVITRSSYAYRREADMRSGVWFRRW